VNPFAALGLPADPGLTDDQVRAAWRAVATRTHPDRDDGGDPAAYSAAAAAYAQLRTGWGRSEALADLAAVPYVPPAEPVPAEPAASAWRMLVMLPARVRHGRPLRLAARALIAAAVALLAVTLIPGNPAAPAVAAGAFLWLAFTARGDLAPPPGR
jgi:curved DNA-binding protein CbpA